MSLISSNYKQRCRSSYEHRTYSAEKAQVSETSPETREKRMNSTKNLEILDSIAETRAPDSETDLRNIELAKQLYTLQKNSMKYEMVNAHATHIPTKNMPFKIDQKLYNRLKQFGFKIPKVQSKGLNSKRLHDFLKIESVKVSEPSYKPKSDNRQNNIWHVKNQRSATTNTSTSHQNNASFEAQRNAQMETRRGLADLIREERDLLKKPSYMNHLNPNAPLTQLNLFANPTANQERQGTARGRKSKAAYSRTIDANQIKTQSQAHSKGVEALLKNFEYKEIIDQITERIAAGGNGDELLSARDSEFIHKLAHERVEHLQASTVSANGYGQREHFSRRIEETFGKREPAHVPVLPIINALVIQSRISHNDNSIGSISINKDEKTPKNDLLGNTPGSPPKVSNMDQISSRDNSLGRSVKLSDKQKLLNTPFVRIKKGQALFNKPSKSIDTSEMPGTEKQNGATTPLNKNGPDTAYSNPYGFATSQIAQGSSFSGVYSNLQNIAGFGMNIGIMGTKFNYQQPPKVPQNVVPKAQAQANGQQNSPNIQAGSKGNTRNSTQTSTQGKFKPAVGLYTESSNAHNLFKSSSLQNKPGPPALKPEDLAKRKKQYPAQPLIFKYFVGRGNNSGLVKRVLKNRSWWEETKIYDDSYNFKWAQTYRGFRYERLGISPNLKQLVNHFEYHTQVSTKNGLIRSLSSYCTENKINLCEVTPTTFIFNMDDEANFDTDMQRFAQFFIKNHPKQDLYPRPDAMGQKGNDVWYNFDYRRRGKYTTPNLENGQNTSPYLQPNMYPTFNKGFTVWVIKPTGLNRGRGIEVFNTLEQLNEIMTQYFSRVPNIAQKKEESGSGSEDEDSEEEPEDKKKRGPVIKSRTFVIQKYIEDLFVVNQRKFDIRVWVLLTHDMQLYFFKEGYLRTCSEIYTLDEDHILDKYVHLTNNAIQKFGSNYGKSEHGNQLSFQDLEKYAAENNLGMDFKGKIYPRMKELVTISMQSAKKTMNQNERKHCFEVFGYDFMIDSEFNVWLIEINTNPCLDESSPLLQQLLPRMIDDAFKLTVDVMFPKPPPPQPKAEPLSNNISTLLKPKVPRANSSSSVESDAEEEPVKKKPETPPKPAKFSVDGYTDDENMWEYLCSLQYQKPSPARNGNKK